ncbi:hypothetical protein K2F54_11240 [Cryobacterium sp. 1639]|uniref:hypothetical protein n=1 Tax=Cryobacterium inferilacus TaxID=2866629 RepID=UPI001C72E837|nr:hypothetical protein [Cryobacterium sp. 1639]MBX0300551.1 hypothetical protein [Cryobacterium sp. 1639]
MSNGVGNGVRRGRYARAVIAVCVVLALLGGALAAAIGSLNRDVYSAGGFVRQYLEALAAHDTHTALALPGAVPTDADLEAAGLPQDLPDTLLRSSVLSSITDIELVRDTANPAIEGQRTVAFEFRLDGTKTSMEFAVTRAGTVAGIFSTWAFATSPLAVLQVTVLHEARFTVNGLTLDTRAHADADAPVSFSNQGAYLAFAPASYDISHESALLTAPTQSVPVVASGATDVTVEAAPNETFTSQVQAKLNEFLDECTTQPVLQPSSCPFGIEIDNRVKSAPVWSIAEYPEVVLSGGESAFDMPATTGQAHIVVDVQSLYDGDLSTRDEDVPFSVGISVTIQSDGSLAIQLR